MCTSFTNTCKIIRYLTATYVCNDYPAISKSSEPNCLKIAETNVGLIVFNGVISDVSAYNATASFVRSIRVRYQKCGIRSMTKNTEVYLTPFIIIKITQLQDKFD